MATPPVVNFITGNANKLREVKAILEPGITVNSQSIDIEEVQGTVEEVTLAKCRKAAETVWTKPCTVDVGLFSVADKYHRSMVRSLSKIRVSASRRLVIYQALTCARPQLLPASRTQD